MSTSHTYKLTAYPKDTNLRDATSVTLKPMTQDDTDALLQFFLKIPPAERHYLKEDVTSPKVIQRWARELDYDRALPILAWANGREVGDGTLHRTRTLARRHVGEIRVVVDPEYRNRGLGTTMMRELATIAYEIGLERLFFQVISGTEDAAIKAAEFIGFVKLAVLPGHGKDLSGFPRDIVIMEMPLSRWMDWW